MREIPRWFYLAGLCVALCGPARAAEYPLYFAQFGGGAGLRSDLVLTNPSPASSVSVTVQFFDDLGSPLEVPFQGSETRLAGQQEQSIPPLGSWTLSTGPEGELKAGSVFVTGSGPIDGVIRFQIPGIGIAGVGTSLPSDAFILPARREPDGISTGLAIQNTAQQPASLDLVLRDQQGEVVSSSKIDDLPARGHLARYLEELFPDELPAQFDGTISVEVAAGMIAATALELGLFPGQLTALPVTHLLDDSSEEDTLYFAQFGNGAGLQSAIILVNPSRSLSVTGRADFTDNNGLPLPIGLAAGLAGASPAGSPVTGLEFQIPPQGQTTLLTDGEGDLLEGSVRVESSGDLGGVIRYEIANVGTTAVPESMPLSGALVPVRKLVSGLTSGIALQNVGDEPLTVDLSLRDDAGLLIPGGQSVLEDLPPHGHKARFFDELFPHAQLGDFVGTISLESRGTSFSATSVEFGQQMGELTTLPVSLLQGTTRKADTVGVFNVLTNYVVLSLDNAQDGAARRYYMGYTNPSTFLDSPVAGDFDGDGKDTVGFFNYREARFYLSDTNTPGVFDEVLSFVPEGHEPSADSRGWIPLAGDWSGEGLDEVALYDWSTSTFYFFPDEQGEAQLAVQFGQPRVDPPGPEDDVTPVDPGPFPLQGDWDGDGQDGIGVCYPGSEGQPSTFHLKNRIEEGSPDIVIEFGEVPGYPLAGDWDGDGIDTIGLYDSTTKTFYLRNSLQSGPPDHTFSFTDGELFECLICNRFPPRTIPGVFPLTGHWSTDGNAAPSTGYNWPVDAPENQGLDPAKLQLALEEAEQLQHLRSLLVVRHGKLVMEEYLHGYDGTLTQNIKSVSKSLLSALFGIAYDKGLFATSGQSPLSDLQSLRLHDLLPEYSVFPEITLFHLMTMSTGLDVIGDPPAEFVLSENWVEWTVHRGRSQQYPLGVFNYSTAFTHVGSEILTRVTGMPTLDFARKELFEPLGISTTRWDHEPNPTSPYNGGWEVFMRPRDMARFGQLFLQKGRLDDGTQLISEKWIEASTEPIMPNGYSLWWWTGSSSTRHPPFTNYQHYYANGLGGQRIFVLPALDMVVVMTSLIPSPDPNGQGSANNQFLSAIVDAVVD